MGLKTLKFRLYENSKSDLLSYPTINCQKVGLLKMANHTTCIKGIQNQRQYEGILPFPPVRNPIGGKVSTKETDWLKNDV